MVVAPLRAVEARVGRERLAADEAREAPPGVVDLRRDHDVAVPRGEHAVERRVLGVPRLLHWISLPPESV